MQTIQSRLKLIPTELAGLAEQFIMHGYESRGHAKDTMKTRQTHLKQFVQYCSFNGIASIERVNLALIDDYFGNYQKTHAKSTANTGRRILKVFISWVIEYKEMNIRVRPEAIRLVKEPKKLPQAIGRGIIRNAIEQAENNQDRLIIAVLSEAGLRIGEVYRLSVGDIQGVAIHIKGKGERDRIVYVTDDLATAIERHISGRRASDPVFYNEVYNKCGRMSVSTLRVHIQHCFADVGIKVKPHQLRHSFAIFLLESGCNIITIQHLLGHKYVTTTQEYLRVTDEHLFSTYRSYIGRSVMA